MLVLDQCSMYPPAIQRSVSVGITQEARSRRSSHGSCLKGRNTGRLQEAANIEGSHVNYKVTVTEAKYYTENSGIEPVSEPNQITLKARLVSPFVVRTSGPGQDKVTNDSTQVTRTPHQK